MRELHDDEYFREYRESVDTVTVLADLPERYSVGFPPVSNNIYRSAVPAPNYLPATTALFNEEFEV